MKKKAGDDCIICSEQYCLEDLHIDCKDRAICDNCLKDHIEEPSYNDLESEIDRIIRKENYNDEPDFKGFLA